MTMTALPPTRPSSRPALSKVQIDGLHLTSIRLGKAAAARTSTCSRTAASGSSSGRDSGTRDQIHTTPSGGTIVIALNVDEDHDEVHYLNLAFRGEVGELLGQAIETLVACRNALTRGRKS